METSSRPAAGKLRKILIPTDGSEFSSGAERVALALCQKTGARLIALRAVPQGSDLGLFTPEAESRLEAEASEKLATLKKGAAEAGVVLETVIARGDDPYRVIVDQAKELGVDLIVMGRRGRRGLARLMLGDATAKVIGYAPCEVMVVPKASNMSRQMLIGVDGSAASERAIPTVAGIAQALDLPLTVLSVMVPGHNEARRAEAGPIVERAVARFKGEGVAAEGLVESGPADEMIVAVANRKPDTLIVLGSHGRTGLGRVLFGSNAERVINQTSGPVLVTRAA